MLYLKQSTASQSILLGPFVDATDGVTAETGLTIANTDIRLSANGGNMFAKTSGGGTHDEIGYYTITLDATDTATVGRLQIAVAAAGALPVYHECQVLEENVYDAIYGASAALGTDVASVLADTGELQTDWLNGGRLDLLIDAILADTGELQTDWVNGGRLDLIIDAILADTAVIGAAGVGLTAVPWNAAWDAEVQSEVDDALDTAIAELGVAAPTATPTVRTGLMLLYMTLRNKTVVQTSGTDALEIHNDAGTKIAAKLLTDDGSDYTEAEMA